jgi:hypothetical protein
MVKICRVNIGNDDIVMGMGQYIFGKIPIAAI